MLEKLSNTTITVMNLLNSRAICMGNNATTSFDPTTSAFRKFVLWPISRRPVFVVEASYRCQQTRTSSGEVRYAESICLRQF
jgi:hypothetical protein